jgi:hypothetical protein
MRGDITNNIDPVTAIAPIAAGYGDNTVIRTAIVDTAGCDALTLVIQLGALYAGMSAAVKLEHGNAANLSDAADVSAEAATEELSPGVSQSGLTPTAEANAGFSQAGGDANTTKKIGYVGGKRYVRGVITPANNGATSYWSATWLRGDLRNRPAPNPPGH